MSTLLERLEYGFDRDSRRMWRRRALATGEDSAYGYDGLSQVMNAARGNLNLNATAIGGVPAQEEAWDYDPTGNWRGYRVEEDGAVTLDQQRVHDKGNRLTQIEGSAEPVLVDRAGRMRQVPPDAGGDWSEPLELVWDAWSRLVEVRQGGSAVGSYAYDGLSRRTARTTGGGTLHSYYSDVWRPLEERQEGEDTAALQYYWGARHRDDLVRRDRATTSGGSLDETRYVLMDYFSPAAITDEIGNVTERYAFSAFGVRRILNPDFTPRTDSECDWEFAFQGQFLDTESGFLDYGFRYYSPFLGRWTCKDPIGERGGFNLYAMVKNNPIATVDQFGLDEHIAQNINPTGLKKTRVCSYVINQTIALDLPQGCCEVYDFVQIRIVTETWAEIQIVDFWSVPLFPETASTIISNAHSMVDVMTIIANSMYAYNSIGGLAALGAMASGIGEAIVVGGVIHMVLDLQGIQVEGTTSWQLVNSNTQTNTVYTHSERFQGTCEELGESDHTQIKLIGCKESLPFR